jgi:hypothetical protein
MCMIFLYLVKLNYGGALKKAPFRGRSATLGEGFFKALPFGEMPLRVILLGERSAPPAISIQRSAIS